jgi:hypothetical protein
LDIVLGLCGVVAGVLAKWKVFPAVVHREYARSMTLLMVLMIVGSACYGVGALLVLEFLFLNFGDTPVKHQVLTDTFDLFAMVAGALCTVVVVADIATFYQSAVSSNFWMVVLYILCVWIFGDVIFEATLGPWLTTKFQSVSTRFTFLQDKADAKNFIVIVGAWTAVLNALASGNAHAGSQFANWEIWIYFVALVLFGLYLVKGWVIRLSAKLAEKRAARRTTNPP